jgi:hypothetical protein
VARLKTPSELRRFVMLRADVESVVQRIGDSTYDLVLVDVDGNWTRWVFVSEDHAKRVAADLGIPVHDGWDGRISQRINRRDHWNEPGGQHRAL